MNEITVDDVSVGYGQKAVARDLSATFAAARLTCLLGRNGVGKSTLLRTIAGLLPPLRGDVRIGAVSVSRATRREMARLVSIVQTRRPDVRGITVEQMVAMGRQPYTGLFGKLSAADIALVEEALGQVGITALRSRAVHTLSDGEMQKTMLAKALAQQTPVILLDEPTAFLDYPSKAELMRTLSRVCREAGRTALLSTHDVPQALECSHRVWLMAADGKLSTGTPEEIKKNGLLSRVFGM